jgi:hypothetical protein
LTDFKNYARLQFNHGYEPKARWSLTETLHFKIREKGGDSMGDKGGKKDKEKGQKQNADKQKQKSKDKSDKQPKRRP